MPVEYPTACRPQAWAAATPLLAIRTLLGLDMVDAHLRIDPVLPDGLGRLVLRDIPVPAAEPPPNPHAIDPA
jgi:glycogen debranching enzyme